MNYLSTALYAIMHIKWIKRIIIRALVNKPSEDNKLHYENDFALLYEETIDSNAWHLM